MAWIIEQVVRSRMKVGRWSLVRFEVYQGNVRIDCCSRCDSRIHGVALIGREVPRWVGLERQELGGK